MLKLWGMRSAPTLPLHSGPIGPSGVTCDWVLCIGQIEPDSVLYIYFLVMNERDVLTLIKCK